VESGLASPSAETVSKTATLAQLWSQADPAESPAPAPPRRRIGRGRVFAWIKQQVGDGGIEITADAVARQFGWLVSSARDCLHGLCADGLLRVAGRAAPRGPVLYELTAAGAAKRSKVCRTCRTRRSESAYSSSRWTVDGLADVCRNCVDAATKAGRRGQAADHPSLARRHPHRGVISNGLDARNRGVEA
jgi:hypothetical protein